MAHSSTYHGTIFHYNGDYSGSVEIIRNGERLLVPFEALEDLVIESIKSRKISELEQMKSEDFIKQLRI